MKQITIRLNDQGEKVLEEMKGFYQEKKNQTVIEKALLLHLDNVRTIHEQAKKIHELESIIKYLEEQKS